MKASVANRGLILCLALSGASTAADCPRPGMTLADRAISANPNRPTISDPADITECGVVEVEYGWSRGWSGAGNRSDLYGGLIKFGLLQDLELRWTLDSFLSNHENGRGRRGVGDHWTGLQYRFHHQSKRIPTMALGYAIKRPSADRHKELGSGHVDHAMVFLASKDIRGLHWDFNTAVLLAGRDEPGRDRNVELALAFSRPIQGRLGITGEVWGDTRQNTETPGFASTLWGLTYAVRPRLVVDAGVDFGLTTGTPRKRFFAGLTYALADVYGRLARRGP